MPPLDSGSELGAFSRYVLPYKAQRGPDTGMSDRRPPGTGLEDATVLVTQFVEKRKDIAAQIDSIADNW